MKKLILFFVLLCISQISFSQVGIGTTTPDTSAILDITATDTGILIPRMTTTQRDLISAPANGLMIYNTDSDEVQFNANSTVTPVWQAFSLAPSGALPGTSMKYSNTDITTDVNLATAINLPVFGSLVWNDNTTLYAVAGNQVTISQTGRYEFIINASIVNSNPANDRNAPEIRLAVNGTEIGTYGSTGYIRSNNNHEESSLHIREVLEITAGQIITIHIIASANVDEVFLRSAGTSNVYIEKVQ